MVNIKKEENVDFKLNINNNKNIFSYILKRILTKCSKIVPTELR